MALFTFRSMCPLVNDINNLEYFVVAIATTVGV